MHTSAHSVIADQFPLHRRPWRWPCTHRACRWARSVPRWLAGHRQRLGWRATFYVLGATGLIFAFLFPLVVPEPPRTTAVESTPSFGRTLRFLVASPSSGTSLPHHGGGLMGYSMTQYMTSFFIRTHGLAIGHATRAWR